MAIDNSMRTDLFDFPLPPERIAPLFERLGALEAVPDLRQLTPLLETG